MYTDYKIGDEVFICGVVSRVGYNPMCRGRIVHSFLDPYGHGNTHYVIGVDVLDGGFEVRDAPTMAPSLDVCIGSYGHLVPRKPKPDDDPKWDGHLTADEE